MVGPTASGKSALAVAAAAALGDVEIVSVDSMVVYREMDIGTAKPSAAERAAVPHHLLDVADPAEDFSLARFQALAGAVVAAIEARGHRALFAGGTGLYYQAVVDGLEIPGEDLALRAELDHAAGDAGGLEWLYGRLRELDPLAASRIEPGNRRRVVRALEVTLATGRPFSSYGPGLFPSPAAGPVSPAPSPVAAGGRAGIDVRAVGVWLSRAENAARIEERFAAMTAAGLVDEVARLDRRAGGLSRTARQAIGYKEVLAHLAGETTLEAAVRRSVERTRGLARRQRMWFRRDARITWLGASGNPIALLPALLATWSSP